MVAGLLVVFVWVSIWFRFREPPPEPPPEPADVRAWDYIGCHRLQFGDWVADGNGGETAAAGVDSPEAASVEAPPVVRSLMLLPDSVDQYGREMNAYRAVALEADVDPTRLETRWFTRADTLWLVWSSPEVRGAVALREGWGAMAGRAVARLRARADGANAGGDGSVQTPVSAWPVNCHSLRPNRILPVNR